jgi:hypothetical protein
MYSGTIQELNSAVYYYYDDFIKYIYITTGAANLL